MGERVQRLRLQVTCWEMLLVWLDVKSDRHLKVGGGGEGLKGVS